MLPVISSATRVSMMSPRPRSLTRLPASHNGRAPKTLTRSVSSARSLPPTLIRQPLVVRTLLNDQERQNYPVSDAIFGPAALVSLISRDMTLEAGDVIACGTSVGVGSMKPGSTVSVVIDGIGTLTQPVRVAR